MKSTRIGSLNQPTFLTISKDSGVAAGIGNRLCIAILFIKRVTCYALLIGWRIGKVRLCFTDELIEFKIIGKTGDNLFLSIEIGNSLLNQICVLIIFISGFPTIGIDLTIFIDISITPIDNSFGNSISIKRSSYLIR